MSIKQRRRRRRARKEGTGSGITLYPSAGSIVLLPSSPSSPKSSLHPPSTCLIPHLLIISSFPRSVLLCNKMPLCLYLLPSLPLSLPPLLVFLFIRPSFLPFRHRSFRLSFSPPPSSFSAFSLSTWLTVFFSSLSFFPLRRCACCTVRWRRPS